MLMLFIYLIGLLCTLPGWRCGLGIMLMMQLKPSSHVVSGKSYPCSDGSQYGCSDEQRVNAVMCDS